ncbi:Re/Si-specific NAD(P)(+) transhydrogenase subunit alpha [Polynucleobacter sp. IMCC30063]|uniref:Re/Si-specific NAD(P)(+) transhydrogenase subunit alpha n=1 Tax=unclassified Polynucleobacter TaxID=2640945 RepID=UPI001F382E67|nr:MULTISPECIES: Re/Si-specific NAD(P)(+) transhydrogenase subunit alpha [unclassified Polynucleobacter]MCE7506686.1 Re/Si-specific NAD(P)(+) transhydrogenase subunit alpha [Polynucleobacter sp. IMCC30063]MCE7526622.1 Re/Si-specific NAD(P)(+) transhydrogenase subunit alpha [Polynucleobacter sp. IMCC 30228]MCE7530299.1 Re/Si-specific NAD(P)(+) transhydrogenase subunit alpha [Polynucleobacter sp. IMCC 29146]
MRIGVPLETRPGETRVAATPETVKKLTAQGHQVVIQSGAGIGASQPDSAYEAVGASIGSAADAFGAEIVLKVRAPQEDELKQLKSGSVLIGMLDPFDNAGISAMAAQGITAFALEAAPRTTRAQSMDVLSSQANIAGYKAVLVAANEYQRFMPMLMTAAGTVKAARILILGAGVAGLQAIATAKRLGAVIEASDVRPAAKEQIESLGAKFVDVPFETDEEREIAKGVGGYARPMPESWMKRQAVQVAERAQQADIVITTALIPGRKPPVLLHSDTVANMKPGSIVIDLAAGRGENGSGNCPLTRADQIVINHGVKIIGYTNLPSMVAADASALYARNVLDFMKLIVTPEAQLVIPAAADDDIVAACLMCRDGQVIRTN